MSTKVRNIIGWVLTGLIAFVFIGSAIAKLSGGERASQMVSGLGISMSTVQLLGVVELVSLLLFIIPRTGVLGTLLLAAYMGGAIATHLEHQLPVYGPCGIEALIWIAAVVRFPELSRRLLGNNAGN